MVTPSASRHTLYALISLCIFNHAALAGSRVTVSLFALWHGASALTVGTLMALYALLPMFLSISAGRLSDRIGVRKPMLVGSIGVALGTGLPFIVPTLGALYLAAVLIGVGFMLFQVSAQNATGELGPVHERAENFSLLALGYSLSGFCGPLIAGFTIDHVSHRATFFVLALLPLVPIVAFTRDRIALPRPVADLPPAGRGIAELIGNAKLRRIYMVSALLSGAWDLHTFFIPIYGARIGLSASQIGFILAAFALATFVVRLIMPRIARRFSELAILTAALFVAGFTYFLFPLVKDVATLMSLSFMLGLSLGCGQPMVMSLLHQMAPAGRMGEAAGLRMSIVNSSSVAVPLVFGVVGTSLGLAPVFWSVGACLATGGWLARAR